MTIFSAFVQQPKQASESLSHEENKARAAQKPDSSEEIGSDESSDTSSERHGVRKLKRSTTPLEKITSEEKSVVKGLADFAASTLDNIDDDNHKRIVLQILGAKKMKLEGNCCIFYLNVLFTIHVCVGRLKKH